MSSDDDFPHRMHPDDLAAITDALRRGIAPGSPTIDTPPMVATGADAKLFRSIVREKIERNKQAIKIPDEASLRRIVKEKIDRDREQTREACRRMIHEEIDKEIRRVFADLEMPIDEDSIKDTRKKLYGIFDAFNQRQTFKKAGLVEVLKVVIGWVGGAIVTAAAVFFGVRNSGH